VAPEAWSAAAGRTGERTGGAETQQLLFAEGLRARGWPVTLLVSAPCGAAAALPDWVVSAYPRRDRGSRAGFLRDSLGLLAAMDRSDSRIFVQRCAFHDAPRVALFSGLLGARFVFWVGAAYNVDRSWIRENLHPVRAAAYLAALRSADAVVCQTREQAEALRRGFGIAATLIPNAVRLPGTARPPQEPLPGRPPLALWGGRVNANKRPELLVDLARSTPGWRFTAAVVRERGREREHGDFLRRAAEAPLLEVVEDLSHEAFLDLASGADLMLNTSRMEGCPNTLLEGFARGVPALTLGVDPDGDIERLGIGWTRRSVEEASSLMRELAEDPGRLAEAGRKAAEHAGSRYSEEGSLDLLEDLLQDLGAG